MEQGEGDGHPSVEGGGGDADLAGRRDARGPRGAGVRHAGDTVRRQQAARVYDPRGTDGQLHKGKVLRTGLIQHSWSVSFLFLMRHNQARAGGLFKEKVGRVCAKPKQGENVFNVFLPNFELSLYIMP